jgi:glyoxylase-like metal-dependent hydrolase (beta-lactamase superfamily II)
MELSPNLHAFLWNNPGANNCNSYLIRGKEKLILIDPGHAAYFDHVRDGLSRLGLKPENIDLVICTHAHPDHIEAVSLFADMPARFTLHRAEWELLRQMAPYLKNSMNMDLSQFDPDFFLAEGELVVGDIALSVHHTPGHSPGGITLHWPAEKTLFTGDLIFKGGLGRTDLPGGNGNQLKESIRFVAGIAASRLLSGHGEVLSGVEAVADNFAAVEQMWFGYI